MHTPLHARQRGPLNWALLLLATLLLNGGALRAQTADTYSFTPSTGTYTPLTGGTPVTTILSDDALSGTIPLPFSFVFDGNTYTSCKVSSNGWLTFNPNATANSLTNDLENGTASERPRVAPFWDDLTGTNGTASYLTSGTAPNRVFTFEWRNWARLSVTGSFSMQVQLVEGTNVVRFVYSQGTSLASGVTASIGLSGAGSGPNSYLSLSNSSTSPAASSTTETDNISTFPATGQIYSFTPPIITACPTPRIQNSATTTNSAIIQFNTTNTPSGPFTIYYGPAGFNPAQASTSTNFYTTVTTPSSPYIINGLTAQTTYQFYVVQNCGGATGNSSFSSVGSFTTNPNPATNDNCAQAVALPVANTCTTPTNGTVFGATQSTAPTSNCTATTANDVWYSFVANGRTQTITFTPQFAGVLDVRAGNCTSATSIFCTSASAGSTATSNVGGLTNGQTYYVRVYPSGSTAPTAANSTFTLCVTTGPAVPANDECTGAIALSVGNTCTSPVLGTVLAAAQSLPPTSGTGCAATNAYDVWYSFVATGSSQIITFAPSFDGIMNVRSGACATSTSIFCAATAAQGTTASTITGLTNGNTYYVRVYPSTATQPAPSSSSFVLCASGRPLGARAQADTEALVVYPNPSNTGQLTLRLSGLAHAGQATLLNALGQTVRAQALSTAAEQTLATRGLAAGVYTLRVTSGEQVLTRKVVLE
ncbi:T9SS type A sorting domain-containing protein [Hymenobacter properus]|uniref:T9SS type A sorting domain-containing protein n=1 Tax=Hymenobacter properus TaxID=2791026 RepID=A0A931FJQ3_9BACT|nr:T9SS type A sorting domain-containing protein [Hymenobacter properus]MBF9143217.1 T9SS type A sorting domain-containing protein [Hymenobacter properus]MBR7722026.1 T9SS type A sorting domain-containing protein [Microvirga sp. SRT04]